ncbi:hypothetical protein JOF56_010951 [Kibdelosporangium banguiense]|uniref:Uncharacterized protein n=1 Tax=Kibdelosporangium banguiense TaxID=1365924 RepID=A0ABS4U301_9PSEU|nr:hypothetical protein [Kibdelosporangium banguiense]MBP2330566.1 hypothetical protein [Kibdelosporangium banguiense]
MTHQELPEQARHPARWWAALVAVLLAALLPAGPASAEAERCYIPEGVMKRICIPVTTPARPAAVRGYGWVWADLAASPLDTWYTPSPAYQFNSVAGPNNLVTHMGTGTYAVLLKELNAGGGVAHVTAYGWDAKTRCKLISTQTWPEGQILIVRCYDLAGALKDSQFTASYTSLTSTYYPFAYISPAGQHNSTGGVNTVTSVGPPGSYEVTLPGINVSNGTEQVTAQGQDANWCKVAGSWLAGPDHKIGVQCYSPAGVPANTTFTVTYVAKGNIVGAWYDLESLYAWFDLRGPGVSTTWRFANGRPTGLAWGVIPGVPATLTAPMPPLDNGDVQVTAFGAGPVSCSVAFWNNTGIRVQCVDPAGTPVSATSTNTAFLGALVPG